MIADYIVRYNSDPRLVTDNHLSNQIYLLDVDERGFNDLIEAIIFLQECTDPITTIEDLVPELKLNVYNSKNIKYLLPEKNITVKHQLVGNMDIKFNEDAGSWE
jgi:hypothetical protein